MGKAKTISLPNGRTWSKKGDAAEHFKAMLARYRDGSRVSDASDHSDLAALLDVYDSVLDAGHPTKAGVGVSHFERRKDQDHPGHTSCFFVVRTDGTSIDFSTRRALDVAGEKVS
ncbi:MAG: DCL family protein [Methyloversatilis discipulorum]|uniref:DCL family protein n=1 Tax=Methyloversatilis discipulorum TaxID=1119528 RepID=UPI0026ED11CE|nr:DCL family protein [Methyloversatilis discipulorum]MBV5288037.1 DCL family protein [Methyloversatilis discipulorum]